MTIRSPEFETLLTDYYLAAPGSEREAPFDRLVHFIDAHVVSRRRQAVDQFKEMCRLQGLVAVKAEGFNQLLSDLERLPDGDMADHARQLTHDILNAGDSADDGTLEFTVREDEDLDRLLNSTAALLSGRANQDVGMAWYADLQAVLRRLTTGRQDAHRLTWVSHAWGGSRADYSQHVLQRGGDGDLSDIRTFIDEQSK